MVAADMVAADMGVEVTAAVGMAGEATEGAASTVVAEEVTTEVEEDAASVVAAVEVDAALVEAAVVVDAVSAEAAGHRAAA